MVGRGGVGLAAGRGGLYIQYSYWEKQLCQETQTAKTCGTTKVCFKSYGTAVTKLPIGMVLVLPNA
jgi:hypothetical protein